MRIRLVLVTFSTHSCIDVYHFADSTYSFVHPCMHTQILVQHDEFIIKRRQQLEKAMEQSSGDPAECDKLNQKLLDLTAEAEQATQHRAELMRELKECLVPKKQQEHQIKGTKIQLKQAKQELVSATGELQNKRNEIMQREGSAQSEEAKRAEKTKRAEDELSEARKGLDERKSLITESLRKYEEGKPRVEALKANVQTVKNQCYAVNQKVQELKANEGNSLAVFGRKCVAMSQKVEQAKRAGRFRGKVIGPIGQFLKVLPGKEHYAGLAELGLQVGLDKFIVTNDQDRAVYLQFRKDIGCSYRDCGMYQMVSFLRGI